ncbi:MAG: hypothetical protein AAAC47_19870, partial [Pararhizobium sp.]
PIERRVFATLAGPHRDPFDCHVISRLKLAATGRCQARSIKAVFWTTEDCIASGEIFAGPPTMNAPAPAKQRTASTTKIRADFIAAPQADERQDNTGMDWQHQTDGSTISKSPE